MNNGVLSVVGCPERDVADVPQSFRDAGLNVRPLGTVGAGDYVVFCISCVDGPTEGTRQSVSKCAGLAIKPIAIVLTRAELVDDDSLRSLVTLEEMELLGRIMPEAEVERLLLLHDFDPNLVAKVESNMRKETKSITCSEGLTG